MQLELVLLHVRCAKSLPPLVPYFPAGEQAGRYKQGHERTELVGRGLARLWWQCSRW